MTATFERPYVSVDIVLLTLFDGRLQVALHTRDRAPWEGHLALPGGYVHVDDAGEIDLAHTAYRVLREKVGLTPRYLEQLQTFSGPKRDPRGWTVSVSHVALVPHAALLAVGEGVFHLYDVNCLPVLAFDHAEQVAVAVARVRNKSAYSTLPCWLLPERFTLNELQRTYEQIMGEAIDRGTFRSRLGITVAQAQGSADKAGILIATEEMQATRSRPSRLFRVDRLALFKRTVW